MTAPVPLTFSAWRDGPPKRYVTLAELLLRMGEFALELTWTVEVYEEGVHPELERAAALGRIGTLELLALVAPARQLVDGDYDGYDAGGRLVLELQEFDGTSWDLRTAEPLVLDAVRRWFPDAEPSPPGAWDE
ncbi:hypothetical protein [Streptomyces sp. NPDC048340]|uniref:hypothetical protein n=1 Tax=Streptomyces sp. NPDC048340 TaxID=3365537 RepID=UPI00371B8B35